MTDLDELLWNSGPDGSNVADADWERIVEHLFAKLATFLHTDLTLRVSSTAGRGFFFEFASSAETPDPLHIQFWGTCGVAYLDGLPCVKGFIYVYSDAERVFQQDATHIYIQYARQNMPNHVETMQHGSGPSACRSHGWRDDEFEGDDPAPRYWPYDPVFGD